VTPHYQDEHVTLYAGDCLDVLATLPDASVDAVVTDPPYNLGFMGKTWDQFGGRSMSDETRQRQLTSGAGWTAKPYGASGKAAAPAPGESAAFQAWCELWATECLRVLKPGGHLLAFGGTRTSHRLACAIEDAGFEIRDSIAWLYGSGFPKSLDVSKAIDKAAGAERETSADRGNTQCGYLDRGEVCPGHNDAGQSMTGATVHRLPTAPATDDARTWQGWGTALKPAHEPIVVARKPLTGNVAANVLRHGTGAINVDGCRVGTDGGGTVCTLRDEAGKCRGHRNAGRSTSGETFHGPDTTGGRWPANVVLDESQADALDQQSGPLVAGGYKDSRGRKHGIFDGRPGERDDIFVSHGDDGLGASRYYYVAKADSNQRPRVNGVAHPTVKPLALMRWLVRLVTPPGGTVLEPFAGSGATVEACVLEGFKCIAIERETDYLPLIVSRLQQGTFDFGEGA
jgi:site-specific DNA-methyltransferase (adenine-specific)